ncbi:MAG: zf-HC2 domain-containing protein [Chloroflexota bacterium]|nr:zf-HC2 domain-containing protein [Chloroflexota bacterium]
MKCSKVREGLQAYIEGTLVGADLRAFEDHLQSCSDCRLEMEELQELDARLRKEVPLYWESLQPAPGFVARMRHLDLDPQRGESPGLLDSLLALFQKRSVAMAAGLSICIVVALAVTVPGMISGGEESSIVAENLKQSIVEEDSAEVAVTKEVEVTKVVEVSEERFALVAPSVAEMEAEKSLVGGGLEFHVRDWEELNEEEKLAIGIALENQEVIDLIAGQEYAVTEVFEVVADEEFVCAGLIVAVILGGVDSSASLHICVDIDAGEVVAINTLSE